MPHCWRRSKRLRLNPRDSTSGEMIVGASWQGSPKGARRVLRKGKGKKGKREKRGEITD